MEGSVGVPEVVMALAVLGVTCAIGASAAAHVADAVPSGPPAGQLREERATKRSKAATEQFLKRRCARGGPIGPSAPSECPLALTANANAVAPMPDLDTSRNVATNVLDTDSSSAWCGLVAGGQVTETFSTAAALELLHVELTEKDPKGRPCAKNPKVVVEIDGVKTVMQLDDKVGRATDIPLKATTNRFTMHVEVQNTWPGQMFCVSTLRATGRPSVAPDSGSTLLGLADGSSGWEKAQSRALAAGPAATVIEAAKRTTPTNVAPPPNANPGGSGAGVAPTTSAAPPSSAPTAGADARKACISACIARCSDDAVCEGICARNCN